VTCYSIRSLQITRNSLERAIRHAESNDLVGRNVAALVKPPRGRSGRPPQSFTLEQAKALLAAAERTRWYAYVALSLLVGIRTEEASALRWHHVVTWVDDATGWQPVTSMAGSGRAGPGPDTLWTLARALDGPFAVLAGTLEPATGAMVPIVYWVRTVRCLHRACRVMI
jgi:integrase